jgi:hypothetical protein
MYTRHSRARRTQATKSEGDDVWEMNQMAVEKMCEKEKQIDTG